VVVTWASAPGSNPAVISANPAPAAATSRLMLAINFIQLSLFSMFCVQKVKGKRLRTASPFNFFTLKSRIPSYSKSTA
jgi:hypothetical protein